jgi:hypothetical protein
MDGTIHATLVGWHDFYLITGTAAAALTGLQFIVQTLLTSNALRPVNSGDTEGGIAAFGTPTVVHFSLALLVSAVLCMPWVEYEPLGMTLGVLSVGALAYSTVVLRRARRQQSYVPVFEDWLWHILLPGAAYAAVLLAAITILIGRGVEGSLFTIAIATLLLLCVGIHNAWDTVTYLTLNALGTGVPGLQPSRTSDDGGGPNHDRTILEK